jgi:predicted RNase H-like nuclease (RuvC/YqgF family)
MFNLKDVLTDTFVKNCIIILAGVSSGKTVDQIIESLSPKLRKKNDQIRDILDREISQNTAIRLQICLKLIENLDNEIKSLEKEIFNYIYENHKHEREF